VSGRRLALAAAAIAVTALAVAGAFALGEDDNEPRQAASPTTPEDSPTAEPSRTEPEAPREDEPDEGSGRPEGDGPEPDPASQPEPEQAPAPDPAPAAEPARYVPFSAGSGDWQAELPSGNGWQQPAQTQPRPGRLYRVTVRGPAGAVLLIDHMPSAAARFGSKYESRRELTQPWFGSMTEYKLADDSVGYVLNASEAGPGFRVFASGADPAVARRVANRLTYVDL
jgi:hypothetical protein